MKPVFIALDFDSAEEALTFLEPFKNVRPLAVKVGMELFYREGVSMIQRLRQAGIDVFLDLKLHDIPHTVQQAARQIGRLGVQYTTIHALGGATMIQAAYQGLADGAAEVNQPTPKLLAVTQLTSTSEEQMHHDTQIMTSMPASVTHLAQLASQNGADGVISSAWEDQLIHDHIQSDFLCINPGIRLPQNKTNDQKRIVTPTQARELGANGIVVGRSITQASDPIATYQNIYQTINGGL